MWSTMQVDYQSQEDVTTMTGGDDKQQLEGKGDDAMTNDREQANATDGTTWHQHHYNNNTWAPLTRKRDAGFIFIFRYYLQ